jgi:lipid-A-disaccharide synthase
MQYYLIAGEASGDLHASNLIKAIRQKDENANFRAWGGDLTQSAGATLVKHYRDLAFMGFVEVLLNLKTILKNLAFCKEDILQHKPDALILVDYPGFNLRIAEWAKQQDIPVIFYISPQVWAWKSGRVKKMKQCIDKMLVILPFEKDYYKNKWHWEVEYVGHPLLDVIHHLPPPVEKMSNNEIIALLPGSRKQEIHKKLPVMLAVAKHFPSCDFIVAKAPGLDDSFYNQFFEGYKNVRTVSGKTYSLLQQSKAALVTSGTATLETALFKVPQVVCYKGNRISFLIAKQLVKIKFISLVNLIMDKEVVKELIQDDMTTENLVKELTLLLNNTATQQTIQNDYQKLEKKLLAGGSASANAANSIIQFMNKLSE